MAIIFRFRCFVYKDEKLYQGAVIRIGRVRTAPDEKRVRVQITQPAKTELTTLKYPSLCPNCEKINVTCAASGVPVPTVSWFNGDGNLLVVGSGSVNYTVPEVKDQIELTCSAKQMFQEEKRTLLINPIELSSPRIKNSNPQTIDGKTVKLEWEPVQHADHYVIHVEINKSVAGTFIL